MPDALKMIQEAAEKKARVVRTLRSFGGRMSNLINQEFLPWEQILKDDLEVESLPEITTAQVMGALPGLTNGQANAAVKFIKTMAAYKEKVMGDLDSGAIPPNSVDPTS